MHEQLRSKPDSMNSITGSWASALWKPQLNAVAKGHHACLSHQLHDVQNMAGRDQWAWTSDCQAVSQQTIYHANQGVRGGAALDQDGLRPPVADARPGRPSKATVRTLSRTPRESAQVPLRTGGASEYQRVAASRAAFGNASHTGGGSRKRCAADAQATAASVFNMARKRVDVQISTLQGVLQCL